MVALLLALLPVLPAYAQAPSGSPAADEAMISRLKVKYLASAPEYNRLAEARERAQIRGICNIHHIRMTREIVPVVGLRSFGDIGEYSLSGLRKYPNASEYAFPKDTSSSNANPERTASRFVCPECRRVLMQWIQKHPDHPYAKWVLAMPKV